MKKTVLATVMGAMLLSSCASSPSVKSDNFQAMAPSAKPSSRAKVSVSFKANTLFSSNQNQLMAKIDQAGILVFFQGTQIKVLVPVSQFFLPSTSKVVVDKRADLTLIATLFKSYQADYPQAKIKVIGDVGPYYHDVAHYRQLQPYTSVIASFLWHCGIAENSIITQLPQALSIHASAVVPKQQRQVLITIG